MRTGKSCNHAKVRLVTRRKQHHLAHAEEMAELSLKIEVQTISSIGNARPGGSGSMPLGRLDRRLDTLGIER